MRACVPRDVSCGVHSGFRGSVGKQSHTRPAAAAATTAPTGGPLNPNGSGDTLPKRQMMVWPVLAILVEMHLQVQVQRLLQRDRT